MPSSPSKTDGHGEQRGRTRTPRGDHRRSLPVRWQDPAGGFYIRKVNVTLHTLLDIGRLANQLHAAGFRPDSSSPRPPPLAADARSGLWSAKKDSAAAAHAMPASASSRADLTSADDGVSSPLSFDRACPFMR